MSTKKYHYCGVLNGLYQIGNSMEIVYPDNVQLDSISKKHILVYCGEQNNIFQYLNKGQKAWLIEILPIHDKISIPKNILFDLSELKDWFVNKSFEKCYDINKHLSEGMWAFCDLSSCCLIILSADKNLTIDVNLIGQSNKVEKDNNVIDKILELESTIEIENKILKFNKHHDEYQELIKKSCNLEPNIPSRHAEGILLAWLLLNTERSETALRNFGENGEINDSEEYTAAEVRDARFSILKEYVERFISQASSLEDQAQIWATLHFTMFLLELIMGDEQNSDICDDFMGLYPIIDKNKQEEPLCSISPIQYSPQFTYAFLLIPSNLRYRFSDYFRQLLHEFFHYISTDTRDFRSVLLLRMFAYSILDKTASAEDVELLVQHLYSSYKKFGHNSLLFQDSMSLISTMRFVLNRENILDYMEKNDCPIHNRSTFPDKTKQLEYFVDYTFFLREIRSDISMIELLNSDGNCNMGRREYIQLMANEPNWASLSVEDIATEPILRFGYMTNWIKENFPDEETNTEDIIDQLLNSTTDDKLKTKYNNLKKYLEEYNVNKWKTISPCKDDLKELVDRWKENKYIDKIENSAFWQQFLKLFPHNHFDSNDYDTSKAEFDYGIKLLLMALPTYRKKYLPNE